MLIAKDLHAYAGCGTEATNLLQIYKRNKNFQISAEPAAIASMLLRAGFISVSYT